MLAYVMESFKCIGFKQVLHVHDEVGLESPVDNKWETLTVVQEIMETMPEWAEGCPVAAAGFESTRYRKE